MSTKAKTRTTKTVNSKTTKKAVAKKATTNQSTKPITKTINKSVEIKKDGEKKPLDTTVVKAALSTTLVDLKNHHHGIGWTYFELNEHELAEKAGEEVGKIAKEIGVNLKEIAKAVLFENALEGDKIIIDDDNEYKIRYYVDNLDDTRRLYRDTL